MADFAYFLNSFRLVVCMSGLEHLHPWAARQALQMRFGGLQILYPLNFFRVVLPTVTCILALQAKNGQEYSL